MNKHIKKFLSDNGKKGGVNRAKALSKERRSEIASMGATARIRTQIKKESEDNIKNLST